MHYAPTSEPCPLPFNPFKACTVPRPIGWISTRSRAGIDNLAPYSQWQNLTFDPPMVMFAANQYADGRRKHTVINHMLVREDGQLTTEVAELLIQAVDESPTPVLVFAVHTAVAHAAVESLTLAGYDAVSVDGKMSKVVKNDAIEDFKAGKLAVLVGTQTLATGTDGLDRVCDLLVILDDTEDDAMRRQLVGRIMPRGEATTTTHSNRVVRIVASPTAVP